jgi:hypothetical protein
MLKLLKNGWFRFGVGLLFVGISLLIIPSYNNYCERYYSNEKYCAVYEATAALVASVEAHNGAITAVATAIIGYFTWTIWRVNRSQLNHARQVERAYVFARIVLRTEDLPGMVQGTPTIVHVPYVEVVFDNHGKTPADISELALDCCIVEALPKPSDLKIDYERSKLLANVQIGPGALEVRSHRKRELREAQGKVMYGRVYYVDIFGDQHSTGFIYRIFHVGIAAPIEASAEYTSWN